MSSTHLSQAALRSAGADSAYRKPAASLCAWALSLLWACDSSNAEQPREDASSLAQAAEAGAPSTGPSDATLSSSDSSMRDAEAGVNEALPQDAATPARGPEGGMSEQISADAASADASRDAAPTPSPDAGSSVTGQCGSTTRRDTPFGCSFAWGTNDPGTSLPGSERLAFVSKWVGYEIDKAGNLPRCDGCSWLPTLASTAALPVYYAYFIGFLGSANGFADQNVNPNGPNLATDGAQLIRTQRAKLIELYASYARQSARAWPDKPLVWLLEGDFVQYTYKEQKQALSMQELATLARDISCAIKGNMPNAVVAINHTTWLSDEVTNQFWDAMASAGVAYDLVWTTGVANNAGFFERDAKPGIYNQATATYGYVARKTGRKLLVDTSFGLSGMGDTWASASPSVLNQRIADGVIAANVTMPPATYVGTTESLGRSLNPVCK
jgi:hypothetical protein